MKTKKNCFVILIFFGVVLLMANTTFSQETVLELKERIIDIQNTGELGFRNFTLCQNIITYGQYVPYPNNNVKAGSEIYFYYEPKNLFTNRRDTTYQVWYTQDIIVRDSNGRELLNSPNMLNFNLQSVSPVLDLYAQNSLNLGDLPPGTYEFEAVIHDKLKGSSAKTTYVFEIIP
jgi:hypothetical protein